MFSGMINCITSLKIGHWDDLEKYPEKPLIYSKRLKSQ
jgi:hypothetical protein